MNATPAPSEGKSTAKDWDATRLAFHTSIMVDTSLAALAENLDTAGWPLTGADETPAKYLDLPFTELQRLPEMQGHPERIDHLIEILRDTLAFDAPFGEMVEQTEAAAQKDNPLTKNLARLEIPGRYPIAWTQLDAATREFCQREKLQTVDEFAVFAQQMSQAVIVGGDFRRLLNALSNVDEETLAELLPFRPGAHGLHLPEALGQAALALPAGERYALFRKAGGKLTAPETAEAANVSRDQLARSEAALREKSARLFDWFAEEWAELRAQQAEGSSLERYLMVLDDPMLETLTAELIESGLRSAAAPAETAAKPAAAGKSGWRGAFARLFKK